MSSNLFILRNLLIRKVNLCRNRYNGPFIFIKGSGVVGVGGSNGPLKALWVGDHIMD